MDTQTKQAQHTPGPWHIGPRFEHDNTLGICFEHPNGSKTVVAMACPRPAYADNQEANAALIAAAPTLLEACKGLVAQIEASNCQAVFDQDYAEALKAIARADGRA